LEATMFGQDAEKLLAQTNNLLDECALRLEQVRDVVRKIQAASAPAAGKGESGTASKAA